MMTDYPNPYLNTGYSDYQDPYNNEEDYNSYYDETDNSQQGYTENYRGDSSYSEKYDGEKFENTDNYSNNSYDTDRYQSSYQNNEDRDRYNNAQEDRDRQSRRNRSERRRHMRREDGRRDDRRDERNRGRDDRDERFRGDREDRGRGEREERGRDRTRDRDSTRARDHSRDSDKSSHSDRDNYRYKDRDGDRNRDYRDDDRAGEKWITDVPTNTVLLRGLPVFIEEKDIRAELMLFGAPIKDVRLMRKSSGASRGFAFVEFQNIDDALRWMDSNQRKLVLQNQYTCSMNFSTPKDRHDKAVVHKMDWNCVKCGAHNFKRRDHCFGCNMSRYESGKSVADGFDHVGNNPCNTLLFRGLDALTNEENLLRALNNVTQLTCKNVQVIRDPTTQMSAGYAFVELSSVAESMNILDLIKALKPGFEVDGKQILVSFAKNTFSTSIATISASLQTWDQNSANEYYQNYDFSQSNYDTSGYNYSGYYDGQTYDGQGYDYSTYYDTTTTTFATTSTVPATSSSTDATNAAAAVAQAAIQQAQAAKKYQKQIQKQKKIAEMTKEERLAHQAQEWKQKTQDQAENSTQVQKYPPPDVSVYQYDESSGYYYDPVTTLYYDANSQYYYNGNTGQFLYWDAEQSTYLPAPTSFDDASKNDKSETKEEKKDVKEKKEKVKVAKKIAKDMEKWAKSMNAQKEALKDGLKKISLPNLGGKKESATADAGFAILEKTKISSGEDKKLMPPPPPMGGVSPDHPKSGLVASYGGDSDEDEEDGSPGEKVFDESKLLDFSKMACLLCKRQFQSKDQLNRHAQMSDLHKQNLETMRQSQSMSGGTSGQQYRDRAKERREKIGSTAPPPRKRPAAPEPFEQPTKAGIGEDNIGSKMLQKMGWSSGQGLGKKSQGIVNPIQAERRSATAGLGMRGSNYNIEDTDNYKDALRKTMFARYQEIE